jgi:hypothetical protein
MEDCHMSLFLIALLALLTPLSIATPAATPVLPVSCDVTTSLDGDPGISEETIPGYVDGKAVYPDPADQYGENGLWIGLPRNGVLVPPNTEINPDGTITWRKFGIYRDKIARGYVEMTASLLDNPVVTATPHLPDGYGTYGFQVGSMIFPEAGCWQFDVTTGVASMTFTLFIPEP